jgi:hypothetical protein
MYRPAACVFFMVVMQLVACVSGDRAPVVRIDGSSDAAFDHSYRQLLQPLSPDQRRRLALALLSALLQQNCLGTDAVMELTFFPAAPDREAQLRSCRAALNGKSYQDLIDAADAKAAAASVR